MRIVLVLAALFLSSCGNGDAPRPVPPYIVVANRGSASVSVIDTTTDTVVKVVALPSAPRTTKPGYVAYASGHNQLYVGDDANDRIIVLRPPTFFHLFDLAMPADVFHFWVNERQLWATDREAAAVVVFDLTTHARLAVIPIPADLRAMGGVPHDVVVDSAHAYVTILDVESAPDAVVKYSCDTFAEVGRAPVGEDPHVFLHPTSAELYVACQDTDNVFVLDRDTMAEITVIPIFGGHGVWVPPHGRTLYVTNFPSHIVGGDPGPGALGVFAVDLDTNTAIGGVPAMRSSSHNLSSTADGRKLYVTHSNGETKVAVYDLPDPDSLPVFLREIDVGVNPFGIVRLR